MIGCAFVPSGGGFSVTTKIPTKLAASFAGTQTFTVQSYGWNNCKITNDKNYTATSTTSYNGKFFLPFPTSEITSINGSAAAVTLTYNGTAINYTGSSITINAVRKTLPSFAKITNTVEQRKKVVDVIKSYYNAVHTNGRKIVYDTVSHNSDPLTSGNWSYNSGGSIIQKVGDTKEVIGHPGINSGYLNDQDGCGLMECDTFVLMIMLGIPYDKSPYATFSTTYNQNKIITVTQESEYGLNWMERTLDTEGNVITFNSFPGNSAISDTGEMLRDFWRRDWCFMPLDSNGKFDSLKIQDGDIVIIRRPTESYFDGIKHIGMMVWDEDDGKLYIYHVSSKEYTEDKILGRYIFEDYITNNKYDLTEENFYFIRPDYSLTPKSDNDLS